MYYVLYHSLLWPGGLADNKSINNVLTCVLFQQAMTPKCVKHLVNTLLVEETSGIAMMGLLPLAEKHPELLAPHDDAIINNMLINQSQASQASKILVYLAGYTPVRLAQFTLV